MGFAFGSTILRSLGAMHLPGRRVDVGLLPDHGDTMTRYLLLALCAISSTARAVVIRSDVADVRSPVPASAFPALPDKPGEGNGVHIVPLCVVTASKEAPQPGLARQR